MLPHQRKRLRSLAAFGCFALAGCRATPSAPPAPSADVWAVVDGRELRKEDVEKAYRRLVDTSGAPSEDEAMTAKLNLLDEMITQDLVLAKAKALGVEPTAAEVDT